MQKKFSISKKKISWILLGIAFILGCLSLYHGAFVDEADTLIVASLINDGNLLYHDIFSHHFPFPYYWTAFVFSIFGESILSARLSLWIFQVTAFAIAIQLGRAPLAVGLTALFWSILKHHYWGNLLLYDSFTGPLLLAALALAYAENLKKSHAIFLGLFSTMALLSDPRTIQPLFFLFILVFVRKWKISLGATFLTITIVTIYTSYLLLSQTINDFLKNAIFFNLETYSQYTTSTQSFRLADFINFLKNGLQITYSDWYTFSPFQPLSNIDFWIFGGFLYRLGILLSVFWLVTVRNFKNALFLYLYAASLLLIGFVDFHAQSFVITAIYLIFILLTEWLAWPGRWFHILTRIILTSMLLWLAGRVIFDAINQPDQFLPGQSFSKALIMSKEVKNWQCNQEQVYLLIYPGGPETYLYWFLDIPPASAYFYMWPWVADIGLETSLKDLQEAERKIIFLWGSNYSTEEYQYLDKISAFVEQNYYRVGPKIYLSPALAVKCNQINQK